MAIFFLSSRENIYVYTPFIFAETRIKVNKLKALIEYKNKNSSKKELNFSMIDEEESIFDFI